MRPLAGPALALFALVGFSVEARAYDVEVDSETVGQGYQLAGSDGTLIDRRRLDQYLGLSVWNLGPKDPDGAPSLKNQFYFTSSMRFETDFGDYPVDQIGGRNVSDQLGTNNFDLLYAYFGARDLGGFVDLQLGRQVRFEQFELRGFDGLAATVKTPWWFAVEAWGGTTVDGALGIDAPIFRIDGTAPSSLSTHVTDWKPTLGVAVRSLGVRDLDTSFSYIHTFSPAQHSTADERAVGATDGTAEERVAWSIRGRLWDGRVVPWFGIRYDLLNAVIDHIEGGARLQLHPAAVFSAEYLYSYPTFDGDSIWNLFARSQFDDVRVGWDGRFGRIRAYARAFLRFFHDDFGSLGPTTMTPGDKIDWGGTAGARLELPRGYVRLDGYLDGGYGGTHHGVDAAAMLRLYKEILVGEGRLTYAHFADDNRPIDAGDSFGVQLGARVALVRGILIHVLAEENVNKFYSSQIRLYAVLDLSFYLNRDGIHGAPAHGVGPSLGGYGGSW